MPNQTAPRRFARLLRPRDGRRTRDLLQGAAPFGLGLLPERLLPDSTTDTVCGFCSTGCSLTVHMQGGRAVNVTPALAYPVNLGMACPKGWEALAPLRAHDRAITPYLRNRGGALAPVSWERALLIFCDRFKAIQRHYGPDSLAFLSTGQITTEEMALLGSLSKFGMGIRHGDGNTRQCMASAVVAYKEAFGFDAPPYSYLDLEASDVIVLVGSNLCITHPILWQRICRNRNTPEIIVIDPRKTETAMAATRHYAPRPGSDLVLLYTVAHILIERGWIARDYIDHHTEDFQAFAEHVRVFTAESTSGVCGLTINELAELAHLIHSGKRVSFWWSMGVNQGHQGVRTAQALINLALMTGNIGRPGTGANSITGQTNAMGSRLFSNTTSLLGGRDFASATDRKEVANILGIDVKRIPADHGLAYDQIIEEIRLGRIKGLWVVATNPAHSWIGSSSLQRELFDRLDFLVVQDMYPTTDTAMHADLILPAAGAGEKEGTVINSERRIGLYRKTAIAPGQALADFYIFKLIADTWGCGDLFQAWASPESTFQILKRLSRGLPCDFSGIRDYKMIDRKGGIPWPFPVTQQRACGERLFEDGVFYRPGGRAKFYFASAQSLPEPPDEHYPFTLLSGRGTSAQWHTNTRSGKSPVLRTLYPTEPYVEIHVADARELGIRPRARVYVESRRGRISVRARLVETVGRRQLFMPMHYAETNMLTFPAFDPYSRQPAYKACAARVRRAAPPLILNRPSLIEDHFTR